MALPVLTALWSIRSYVPIARTMLSLPETERSTMQFLYNSGFFGNGSKADWNLARALNLNIIVQSFSGLPTDPLTDIERKQDAEELRGILKDTGLYYKDKSLCERLAKLVENPPSVEGAFKLTEQSGNGLDRFLGGISFGRLGKSAEASKAWSEIAALHIAYRVIEQEKEEKQLNKGDTPKSTDILLRTDANYQRLSGSFLDEEDTSKLPKEYIESALFSLKTPLAFRPVIDRHRDQIAITHDLTAQEIAKGKGAKMIPLGEVISHTEVLSDSQGRTLDYEGARAVVDVALLRRTAQHIKQMEESVADQLPVIPEKISALKTGQLSSMATHFQDISQSLAEHTYPLNRMPRRWETDIRADIGARNSLHNVLDHVRQAQMVIAAYGYELAIQASDLAAELQHAENYNQKAKTRLLEQAVQLNDALIRFNDEGKKQGAIAHMLTEISMEHALEDPRLNRFSQLPQAHQDVGQTIDRYYGSSPMLLTQRGQQMDLMRDMADISQQMGERYTASVTRNLSQHIESSLNLGPSQELANAALQEQQAIQNQMRNALQHFDINLGQQAETPSPLPPSMSVQ